MSKIYEVATRSFLIQYINDKENKTLVLSSLNLITYIGIERN